MARNQIVCFNPPLAARFPGYVLYICLSPLIGLVRLIFATGALLGDYSQKNVMKNELKRRYSITDVPHVANNYLAENQGRIRRDWRQIGRAILEMTVVGSLFFAMSEALNSDRPIFQHDHICEMVRELDVGLLLVGLNADSP